MRTTSPAAQRRGHLVGQAARRGPRRRRGAASSRPTAPGAAAVEAPRARSRRRSVMSDTVARLEHLESRSMPSPPACAPAPPLPRRSRSRRTRTGTTAPAPRPACCGCWSCRCARRSCPCARVGRPARRRRSRSTPSRRCPTSTLFIVPCEAAPSRPGKRLGQRAEAHVGDPLAHLDVAGADRGRGPGGHDRAGGRDDRTGRSAPPLAGRSGRSHARSANATALTVTASTAFTLPGRCGSVPVKSNGCSSPARVTATAIVVGCCCSAAGRCGRARRRSATRRRAIARSAARIRRSP